MIQYIDLNQLKLSLQIKLIRLALSFKKEVLYCLFTLIVVSLSLLVEASGNQQSVIGLKANSFEVNQSAAPNLQIQYEFNKPFQFYNPKNLRAPKVLKTNNQKASFKVLNASYIGLDANTELRTLVYKKNRFHAELINGSIIIDNQAESNLISFQVSNLLFNPYKNGIFAATFIDNQLTLQTLSGNLEVGVYDQEGKLKKRILLPKYSQVTAFDALPVEGEIEVKKPVSENELYKALLDSKLLPTLIAQIEKSNIFKLNYKGNEVLPENKLGFKAFLSNLSFNQNRKNYYDLYPFYLELNNIYQKSKTNPISETQLQNLNRIYIQQTVNNPTSADTFKANLNSGAPYLLSISPLEQLYPLKTKLVTIFDLGTPEQKTLTYLEDLYYLYSQDEQEVLILQIIENLNKEIGKLTTEQAKNIIDVIDNLVEISLNANQAEIYDIRNSLFQKLDSPLDRTLFRTKTIQHLARLKTIYASSQLPVREIKLATESLVKSLDPQNQIEYQDFILELEE
jgi:hypothetical protein